MRPTGWRYESVRHSLAARGVRTRRYAVQIPNFVPRNAVERVVVEKTPGEDEAAQLLALKRVLKYRRLDDPKRQPPEDVEGGRQVKRGFLTLIGDRNPNRDEDIGLVLSALDPLKEVSPNLRTKLTQREQVAFDKWLEERYKPKFDANGKSIDLEPLSPEEKLREDAGKEGFRFLSEEEAFDHSARQWLSDLRTGRSVRNYKGGGKDGEDAVGSEERE